jgi:hypothetical protein
VGYELDRAIRRPALLQEEDLAGDVPAEDGDDEVEVAIAIEIGGLNVAHSSQAGEEDPGLVRPVFPSLEPEDPAQALVRGNGNPEIRDQNIHDPVVVQVGDFGVGRMSQIGREHGCGATRPASLADQQLAAGHVAREEIGKIRVSEVNERDVRDRGRFVRAWSGDLTAHKRPHRSWAVRCQR